MPIEAPELSPALLRDLAPQQYFAVWQHVEQYYAFFGVEAGSATVSFLMVGETRAAAETIVALDAAQNARSVSLYDVHELTLADALAAARSRPLPIRYPSGADSYLVGGLALFADGDEEWPTEFIPL